MVEGDLSRRLADIARGLQSGKDVGQAGEDIVRAALDVLPHAAGAGVTLVHRDRRLATVAATSDLVRRGDELQYELQQGPCVDAAWEEEEVVAGDLAGDARWPVWAPRVATELGVRSMLCTQLFTNEHQLGALNLYAEAVDAFDLEDREVARLLAAHAAVAVAAAQQIETLKVAIDRRTTIGKAIGIIMTTYRVDDDRAFDLLRRLSSHENRKLYDVALGILTEHAAWRLSERA